MRYFRGHVTLKDMYGAKMVEDMQAERDKIKADRKDWDQRVAEFGFFRKVMNIDESWLKAVDGFK